MSPFLVGALLNNCILYFLGDQCTSEVDNNFVCYKKSVKYFNLIT